MKLSKELVDSIAKETRQSIWLTRHNIEIAMRNLLTPFGEDGIELNEHCDGCWMPTCEVSPSVHKVITAMRYAHNILELRIDNIWVDARYNPINDLPFVFNELVSAIECELELD